MLEFSRQAWMYHMVTDYDRVIAYAQLTFVVINIKLVLCSLYARKLWNAKWYLDIVCHVLQNCSSTLLVLVGMHSALIGSCGYPINQDIGSSNTP